MPKKDSKYFISRTQYNCPYCETGAVKYLVLGHEDFDWSNDSERRCIRIQCQEPHCKKVSLHMTEHNVSYYDHSRSLSLPTRTVIDEETGTETEEGWEEDKIDELFFYHQPNSTFVIDPRIPKKIREALDEANTSHKMQLSIGSSAALRKAIFELLAKFEIPKLKDSENPEEEPQKLSYHERLNLLKEELKTSHPNVDLALLEDIKKIYSLVSQPLHEKLPTETEWKNFTSSQFLFLLEVVHTLLIQVFIIPSENDDRRGKLSELAKKVTGLTRAKSST